MQGLLLRLGIIIGLGCLILSAQGCAGFEVYGGARRVDTIDTHIVTSAPKTGMADAVYDWLFVNHEKQGKV
jgi:hypothetical protein